MYFTATDGTSKWKISKEIKELSNSIKRLNLINIYRTFQPTRAEYTFFSKYA